MCGSDLYKIEQRMNKKTLLRKLKNYVTVLKNTRNNVLVKL